MTLRRLLRNDAEMLETFLSVLPQEKTSRCGYNLDSKNLRVGIKAVLRHPWTDAQLDSTTLTINPFDPINTSRSGGSNLHWGAHLASRALDFANTSIAAQNAA